MKSFALFPPALPLNHYLAVWAEGRHAVLRHADCSSEAKSSLFFPKYWKAFCKGSIPRWRSWGHCRAGLDMLTSFTLINRRSCQMHPKSKSEEVEMREAWVIPLESLENPNAQWWLGAVNAVTCEMEVANLQRNILHGVDLVAVIHCWDLGITMCRVMAASPMAFVSLIANSKALLFAGEEGGSLGLYFLFSHYFYPTWFSLCCWVLADFCAFNIGIKAVILSKAYLTARQQLGNVTKHLPMCWCSKLSDGCPYVGKHVFC